MGACIVKLKCNILKVPTESDVLKFWKHAFQKIGQHPGINSLNIMLTEHDFIIFLGTDGNFLKLDEYSNHEEYICVYFPKSFDEWMADRLDSELGDDYDDSEREFEVISANFAAAETWLIEWIRKSLNRPDVKSLKAKILGRHKLSLWTAETMDKFDQGKHTWVGGSR